MSKVLSMRRACAVLIACILLAAAAFAVMVPSKAHAEEGADYTFTVRVFPGNIGECSQGDCLEQSGIAFNHQETFTRDAEGTTLSYAGGTITVPKDGKYYIKGVRKSGQDSGAMTNTVTEDMDFVVDYGVKGEMVSVTVNFEDQSGNALANDDGETSVTFWGKKGDKLVVPAEYVPGYRPLYWNIEGTLQDGTNSWTLPYTPLTVEEIVETTTTTEGGAAAGGAAAGGAAAGGAAAGTEGGAAGAAGGAAAGAAGAAGGAAGGSATAAPPTQEILDVDNPLASGTEKSGASADKDEKAEQNGPDIPIVPIVGGIAAAVVAVAAVGAFFSRKKK